MRDRISTLFDRLRRSSVGLAATGVTLVLVGVLIGYSTAALLRPPQKGVLPFQQSPSQPGEFLVKFRPGTPASSVAALHSQHQAEEIAEVPGIGVHRVKVPPGNSVNQLVQAYLHNPNVEYAEPNFIRGVEQA